jgi:hypothetical protein
MTTVAELLHELEGLPADMPVHIWTHEEEFADLAVYIAAAEETSGRSGLVPVVKIQGR